jgi:hypothetical protein
MRENSIHNKVEVLINCIDLLLCHSMAIFVLGCSGQSNNSSTEASTIFTASKDLGIHTSIQIAADGTPYVLFSAETEEYSNRSVLLIKCGNKTCSQKNIVGKFQMIIYFGQSLQ